MEKTSVKQKGDLPERSSARLIEKKARVEEEEAVKKAEEGRKMMRYLDGRMEARESETKVGGSSETTEEKAEVETRAQKRRREMGEAGKDSAHSQVSDESNDEEKKKKDLKKDRKSSKQRRRYREMEELDTAGTSQQREPDDLDDGEARHHLRTSDQLEEQLNQVEDLLPELKGKAISDEDLLKLLNALGVTVDKQYDSDNSLWSESDRLTDAQRAEKDAKFRKTIEFIDSMPELIKALNWENRTEKQKEEWRRKMSHIRQGLKTQAEKDESDKKRAAKKRKIAKLKRTNVQVFSDDWEQYVSEHLNKQSKRGITYLLSRKQFDQYLEVLESHIPEEKKSAAEAGNINHLEQFLAVNMTRLERMINTSTSPIQGKFYTANKTVTEYLNEKVRMILEDRNVREVLDGDRFGFEFSTRDTISVLEHYYSMNKPPVDYGVSIEPLAINIGQLISSAFGVARSSDPNFHLNEDLKIALGLPF